MSSTQDALSTAQAELKVRQAAEKATPDAATKAAVAALQNRVNVDTTTNNINPTQTTAAPAPAAAPTVVSTNTGPDGTVTEIMSDGTSQIVPGTAGSVYQATGQSATTSVDAWATSVGLGSLSGWINSQITTFAGQGMNASDIASTIASTINNAPGFDAILPGYNQRIANGYTNTDANTGAGIAGYMAYVQQLQAMAETAGLVPGTLTATDIGNAWAGDVSTSEMSDRITTEYTNAINAQPQIQAELQNYGYTQGLSTGQLASYYLNPANTINTLQQQFNSAVAGGEGVTTGFGEIGQSQAYALQAFLSNSGQNQLSPEQAANFFSSSPGSGLASLGVMAASGFEQAQLGTAANGPGVVSQQQLLAAGEGNAQALQATQRAAQTRAAPSEGGGGFASDQGGVAGAGFGSS
jgi:hypothetical protein